MSSPVAFALTAAQLAGLAQIHRDEAGRGLARFFSPRKVARLKVARALALKGLLSPCGDDYVLTPAGREAARLAAALEAAGKGATTRTVPKVAQAQG